MRRRELMKIAAAAPLLAFRPRRAAAAAAHARLRPGQPGWPGEADWQALNRALSGGLIRPGSPFLECTHSRSGAACQEALRNSRNPYYVSDEPALTQTSGWLDAWTSQTSTYAVIARSAADVAHAVSFARRHRLRLAVRGGGHSYQGTSCAADSLLIWMRQMRAVELHDAFIAQGCEGKQGPEPAVSLGAGALWADAYDAVTTRGARYVQGGGCLSVGVAGLVQSGGFGSFSKRFGSAAAGLLEAQVVTADGAVRLANPCTHSDLFWGIKGGGGGSLGVITRLTLRTRELPSYFGAVLLTIKAATDAAYRQLIEQAFRFYRRALFNPCWGEQMRFRSDNSLDIQMLFQGVNGQQAQDIWAPLLGWVGARPEYSLAKPAKILAAPARSFWDAAYLQQHLPGAIVADARPDAPSHHVYWSANQAEVGQYLHGYQSAWMPAGLLEPDRQAALADAVFASTRHWEVSFHFNKGLAGAPVPEIAAARDTAMNPEVLDAFALAIIAGGGPPAFAGLGDADATTPSVREARNAAAAISRAMSELRRVAPTAGSYIAESDYFQRDWKNAFWGKNFPALAAVKHRYDPGCLFFVHHGVGSDAWDEDGFTPR